MNESNSFVERMLGIKVLSPEDDTQAETIALAVESARRWAGRRDLSPELRLRRMWTVLTVALNG